MVSRRLQAGVFRRSLHRVFTIITSEGATYDFF
jgi:hypothetical protein